MTCSEFQLRLSAYLDGELSHWKRWKVQNHLRCCRDCAGLLRELEEVDRCLIGAAEADPAPEYLTGAVMWRLPAMPPAWRPRPLSRPVLTGIALAGMQLMAIAGAYWWGFNHAANRPAPAGASVTGPGIPLRMAPQTPAAMPAGGLGWSSPWSGAGSAAGPEMFNTPAPRPVREQKEKPASFQEGVR
ncbi:MAG: anti-sigma factor family protein [Armatimonadota bacterium]